MFAMDGPVSWAHLEYCRRLATTLSDLPSRLHRLISYFFNKQFAGWVLKINLWLRVSKRVYLRHFAQLKKPGPTRPTIYAEGVFTFNTLANNPVEGTASAVVFFVHFVCSGRPSRVSLADTT